MTNHTSIKFHILPFSSEANYKLLIFGIFLIIYVIGIILNSVVIAVICLDAHLHSPMYVFFCNLSSIDICYTTVTVPNLLYILLSGDDLLSVPQCFSQIYCFMLCASAEEMLLFVMGFDRYAAICHPLSYHRILNKKTCILMIVTIWIVAFLNPLLFLYFLHKIPFCGVANIQNFFCDAMDIFNASCGASYEFNILAYAELVVFGLFPIICNVLSYGNIVCVILRIKSKEGRRKTFSTCSSHLIVMTIYYSSGSITYLASFSDHTEIMKQILSAFYVTVVPMINPLIYSLRNSEMVKACQKILKIK
ncbi:hypothetical protein GDO81_023896 [Engystomops pustulosus]|uniref:G-protein coupled receptors family 1 profile domain-containing protein n=1 Tax=Engystomops pustulosus TaxID=76066 RepID=A0AAV6ZU02_ENGPU|nr:hypothetical protein GDO81_023896 [Engystomops pustulosus]